MFSCGEIVIVKDLFDDADNTLCEVVGVGSYVGQSRKSTSFIVKPINKIGDWECYNVHILNIEKQDNNK